jgi:hypothetical protein
MFGRYNTQMTHVPRIRLLLATGALVCLPAVARAQLYEAVGTRAQGMGGAFVAVADDATAAWWNPAGLATGALVNAVVDKVSLTEPAAPPAIAPARRTSANGFAFAVPALGLSYFQVKQYEVVPPATDPQTTAREGDEGTPRVRSLRFRQFGITIGQSLGGHLVVASTLKVLKGGVAEAPGDAAGSGIEQAEDLTPETAFRADLDLGAMVSFTRVRMGISVRNVTTPEFGDTEDVRTALDRQARAGLAILSGRLGPLEQLTASVDADLTRTPSVFGDLRHAAAGVEVMLAGKRLALRAGASRNTTELERTSTSTGISFAPVRGVFIEAARSFGNDESLRGWSSSLRFTF